MNQTLFSTLPLSAAELRNIEQLGFSAMTAIQQQALPPALDGQDLIAQAKTGSGKTAAFGIPLLHKLNPRFFGVQGLVLCPTRELATQVAQELRKLARFQDNIKIVVLTGGVAIGPQIASMQKGAHVVVGTPGRIKDHLRKGTVDIDQLSTLVLDEADRMLDMGFREDIDDIVSHTPKSRQTLLFSATYPDNIHQLSAALQQDPLHIKVESTHQTSTIEQHLIDLPAQSLKKPQALAAALAQLKITQAVIFCNTKQIVEEVNQHLRDLGYLSLALQGDLEQAERDQIYIRFANGSAHFLVATDVAARGLDVEDLPAVVNYDLPHDPEVYIHRIGRTGRAGKQGIALSLMGEKDGSKVNEIEALQGKNIPVLPLLPELSAHTGQIERPKMVTLCLAAGRKDKLRPGDILGALTSKGGIAGSSVGKIHVLDMVAYVAVDRKVANIALEHLQASRIKNKAIRVRRV